MLAGELWLALNVLENPLAHTRDRFAGHLFTV